MIQLRPYQQDLVDRVSAAFRRGAPAVLLQSGTGSGKTATASAILSRAVARGYRAAFFAHLDSLVEDTHERLVAAGIGAGFIQAGRPSAPSAPVQVCSLQTLHARGAAAMPPAQLVILDEAHRAMSASVRGVLDAYPAAALLGLTATPQRGDGRPLGDVFAELVQGPSNRWLTDQGFLVPCDVLAPGGYQDKALAADPVDTYVRHAKGRRAIVFAANKAHANDLASRFVAAGFASDVVVGETSRDQRRQLRDRLRAGQLQVLVGVAVFLEGWDCPEVEVVVLARPFGTCGAYLQAIGRGLRPSPSTGKSRCVVLDLRGAVYLHGLPDEDRAWSLGGKAVRRAETLTAVMRCKECLAVFRPAARCHRCGAETKGAPRIPTVISRAERLERFSALPSAERDARYLGRLLSVARTRLRLDGQRAERWALAKFQKQFGRTPGGEDRRHELETREADPA